MLSQFNGLHLTLSLMVVLMASMAYAPVVQASSVSLVKSQVTTSSLPTHQHPARLRSTNWQLTATDIVGPNPLLLEPSKTVTLIFADKDHKGDYLFCNGYSYRFMLTDAGDMTLVYKRDCGDEVMQDTFVQLGYAFLVRVATYKVTNDQLILDADQARLVSTSLSHPTS